MDGGSQSKYKWFPALDFSEPIRMEIFPIWFPPACTHNIHVYNMSCEHGRCCFHNEFKTVQGE